MVRDNKGSCHLYRSKLAVLSNLIHVWLAKERLVSSHQRGCSRIRLLRCMLSGRLWDRRWANRSQISGIALILNPMPLNSTQAHHDSVWIVWKDKDCPGMTWSAEWFCGIATGLWGLFRGSSAGLYSASAIATTGTVCGLAVNGRAPASRLTSSILILLRKPASWLVAVCERSENRGCGGGGCRKRMGFSPCRCV